ncbi:hypothetical protein T06_13869 [Trichinella sp. T6]|nr:hypothetical protein T06_13869 [Trichinella sp. T6]
MFFVVFNSFESTNVVQWLTSLLPPLKGGKLAKIRIPEN